MLRTGGVRVVFSGTNWIPPGSCLNAILTRVRARHRFSVRWGERRWKKIQFHPLESVDGKTAEEGNPKITRPDSNGDVSFCAADAALRTPFSTRAKEERATIIITHADQTGVFIYSTNQLFIRFLSSPLHPWGKDLSNPPSDYERGEFPQRIPSKKSQHITSFLFLLLCFPITVPLKTCAVLPQDVCAPWRKTRDEQRSFYPFGRQLDGTNGRAFHHWPIAQYDLQTNTFCMICNKLTNTVFDNFN